MWQSKVILFLACLGIVSSVLGNEKTHDYEKAYQKALNSIVSNDRYLSIIKKRASEGDPAAQCVMGTLHECGIRVNQNEKEALHWYKRSAFGGYPHAQSHLGVLYFVGKGTFQDKINGLALVVIASCHSQEWSQHFRGLREGMMSSMSSEEISRAFSSGLAMLVKHPTLKNSGNYQITQGLGFAGRKNARNVLKTESGNDRSLISVSDRWEPGDANDVFYGPGTFDQNREYTRAEIEKMQHDLEGLVGAIKELRADSHESKKQDVREKIESMKLEAERLRQEAYKSALTFVAESMSAGLSVQAPPMAFFLGVAAISAIKDAAEKYCEALNVEKEVQSFIEHFQECEEARTRER
jgi:TPR repeat protein